MKVIQAANGKKRIKMSKSEWENIGKKHGWMEKTSAGDGFPSANAPGIQKMRQQYQENPQPGTQPQPKTTPSTGTNIDPNLFYTGLDEFQQYFINYFAKQPNLAKWIIAIQKDPRLSGVTAKLQTLHTLMNEIHSDATDAARSNRIM